MVITALMAGADPEAKVLFDGLSDYVLAHPSSIDPDLLAAEQDADCDSVNGADAATDGDLDVAYALLLADRQWGRDGERDYRQLALRRIDAIERSEINPETHLTRLGDWATSDDPSYWLSRSSDWMIGHFKAFRTATGDPVWDRIIAAHQTVISDLQARYAPETGLLSDFVQDTDSAPRPAVGEVLESPDDGSYSWNACRDPWRLGTDAVLNGDAWSRTAARTLNRWIQEATDRDPSRIAAGYRLDGSSLADDNEPAFVAPFTIAAMTDPGSQDWLDALWNHIVDTPIDPGSYYEATITMQVMLIASGNFWAP
jgi:hypothetical protein